MAASKLEVEVAAKSPADKLWEGIRDSAELFPKIFPDQYRSIEIVEGDGKNAGTVRLLKYSPGVPLVTFAKEKIEEVDEKKKQVSYSVIEGELVSFYSNFKAVLRVEAAAEGEGSVVKWCVEYEKVNEEVPEPQLIKDTAVKTFAALDDYLINN